MSKNRMQPLVAFRALKRLINDPERTEEVFTIIKAMSGNAVERAYRRFCRTTKGQVILREQRSLLDTLRNREYLQALPEDTLGRHYRNFLEREGLSPEGLVDASDGSQDEYLDPGLKLYTLRLRDQHDLWHVVTGYGRDTFGEACLLAFTYAQTKNRGIGLIALIGMLKLSKEIGPEVRGAWWRAWRDGRKAAWLPAADWEALLELPIAEVRRQLNVGPPQKYLKVHADYGLQSPA